MRQKKPDLHSDKIIMEHSFLLQVKDLSVYSSGKPVLDNVSFEIYEKECLAIIGPSGSGKSTLIKSLAGNAAGTGKISYQPIDGNTPFIVTISHQHTFKNLSNTSLFYYQQRFNSFDSEDALMVNEVLIKIANDEKLINETLELLGISYLRFTRLIQLSNGEHKRFQLAKAVLQNADWLLLDSPYTGLDKAARKLLNEILDQLVEKGLRILLVTSGKEMPDSITHIACLENGELKEKISRKDFENNHTRSREMNGFSSPGRKALQYIEPAFSYQEFSVAIEMIDACVVYNNRKILDNINWKVKKGECWNVTGHNGSGKSTLLSLVTGDNPQAFANEIYLFDRKKGSGESIWDIKHKIGYVSPELHHYFEPGSLCFNVVASGLFDTIGLFRKLNEQQILLVRQWMALLHIGDLESRYFNQLSNGEQRLVLLARALVKNPPVLILDEPCQGLDAAVCEWFIQFINDICVHQNKTLIYVSHYEEEIPGCVNKTLKLENGKIAA